MTDPAAIETQHWTVDVAGYRLDLPIVPIKPDFAISLMMVIDLGVRFGAHVGEKLAAKLAPLRPDVIVGAATLGIPVAIEVSRALGLDRYVILQKSPKIHLGDALVQTITSITSKGEQRLLLDRQAVPLLAGKRVVMVDDVVASGSSLKGSMELVRKAGGEVVGVGVILTEARDWQKTLGADSALVQSLAHIPQFRPGPNGWEPIAETFL
ncbi:MULTISPECIES: phosphoribosyltransferase family protein [unclassified Rhizobium]|uniref:phosphoribosyltransferase family protein n=1 Tax=unclassified Rhizobium TaxID=2613769 RepID=UPI001AD9D97D|nr:MULTISPECIES: phosphoribosyltransferase family protein [unclassified Rhizobium]MBO9097381.1 adenine phosphoribosyltransferase [Rhizobium sp. L58/93]MBO9133767.1 adenine phosphoribosyltransferase [Rhizobium sp. B209b/85]MBO9167620.1 adenine phosphoribosyltransferase [Rhizobium sp. L245/93]MBO9183579.1 adenine phosphoribosyltransferase [Rhizobium sp. E27B/91]QXZ83905.1 adenine phosphoribosyltransferase [Rhizobium sp. K1/93]